MENLEEIMTKLCTKVVSLEVKDLRASAHSQITIVDTG